LLAEIYLLYMLTKRT